ncbi:hypothetical protein [Chengkuizengella axinellae]|uniref:Uncharacterized protein n=1 Tax=Chengkuizengella axinellae TaxID=3064388 RepID=A0ABT9IVE6_9BACL|nr:hypothetical protein [Chengkuizengella sp. 2205SS18-9]MDP5273238.1 hypothetical protein [Chengkuizengella sp. 2205SS18-9]
MGVFDESICDCCVCPMQCVLDKLIGEQVFVRSLLGPPLSTTINDVRDFLLFTTNGVIPI